MTTDPGLKRHPNGRAAGNKESKHLRPADEILRPRRLVFQRFRDPAFSGIAGRIPYPFAFGSTPESAFRLMEREYDV
jgi:hypothetical protein